MRFLILPALLFSLLAGCGPVRDTDEPQVDPELGARQYMQTGNYVLAAQAYLALAEQDKTNANTYRLKATAAFIEAGDYDSAFKVLQGTQAEADDSLQNVRQRILGARLNLEFGLPGKARDQLQSMPPEAVPNNLRYAYHDILSRSYVADAEYLSAINERLVAEKHASERQRQQNERALWQVFQAIPGEQLDSLQAQAPATLTSWFQLNSIYRIYRFDREKLNFAIDSWVQRYPGHPAFSSIVPGLLEKSAQYTRRPEKIGLLLPLSNQFKNASVAVRDGFLAAWYFDTSATGKPEVRLYDANAMNIIEAYQQAMADGVDYVVGPLEKAAVEALLGYGDLPVPVLALNRLDNTNEVRHDKLVQFGLSPEEEARQVAEIAMADGHKLALVMTPDNNWGQRIAESFTQRWLEIGGTVLEQARFSSDMKDYATPVKEVLNVDSSEARIAELKDRLNLKINANERRREDADFIFAAAVPTDARQLLPQVRFYRADDLPIYSTSHIFTGVFDSTRDTDMNDVDFVDMPWLLDTRRQLSLIQDSLNRNWSQDKSSYRRLYALGIDAYRLIPEMNRLRLEQDTIISGETGDLRLDANNIIQRKLRRARFIEGQPVLLN